MIPGRTVKRSTTAAPASPGHRPARHVAWDDAVQLWLVLAAVEVSGMPTFVVEAGFVSEAAAERAAGHHVSATTGWLLLDPAIGYRLAESRGWTAYPRPGCLHTEAAARAIHAAEPKWQLRVLRRDGRVTYPDVSEAELAAARRNTGT